MNDGDETASIDLAVTFFACILVLFVFVSFAATRAPETAVRPSTGQSKAAAAAVPSAWDPVRERTSFALLTRDRLIILESRNFIADFSDIQNWEQSALHYNSASPSPVTTPDEPSPSAFALKITTAGDRLPPKWVRMSADVAAPDPQTGETCDAFLEKARLATPAAHVTVLADPRPSTNLEAFLRFAQRCGLRHKLVVLPQPKGEKPLLSINLSLDREQFTLETLFR